MPLYRFPGTGSFLKMTNKRDKNQYDGKIAGLYDLEDTLGRGHFAVVKLAKHVFTGEKVAVKVIDKTKLDEVSRAHLFQEVRCMKLVQHPNVVRLYEVIDTQTKLYLILELGDGGDMYDYIMKHEKGLDEVHAKRYFSQIVHAISYCHKLHVVHRDLKPENVVFFEKLGMVKLTDFGFSNKFCPGEKLETSCGSLAYSAPEILLGDSYDAPAVDVWSLGVILYMLVCGHAPFQEANDSETLTMIMDCKYTILPHVSSECQRLIAKMLVREPEKRATLEEIASDPWLADNIQPGNYLPLVSREHLAEEDHNYIIQKMAMGQIASKEGIVQALEANRYNHITATYFLLAERKLRKQRQEQAQLLNKSLKSESYQELSPLAFSPSEETTVNGCEETRIFEATKVAFECKTSGKAPSSREHSSNTVDSLVSPVGIHPTTNSLVTQQMDLCDSTLKSRKCSIVQEDSGEEDIEEKLEIASDGSPIRLKKTKTETKFHHIEVRRVVSSSSSPSSSPIMSPSHGANSCSQHPSPVSKFKALSPPNRKLHSVKSSPQLMLNEIFEEGESDEDGRIPRKFPSPRILHTRQSVASPEMMRRFEQRRKLSGSRATSCSSSDASDDDTDNRKRKDKLKNLPRRDSHDDPPDNYGPGGGSGSSGGNSMGSDERTSEQGYPKSNPNNKNNSGNQSHDSKSGGKKHCMCEEKKCVDHKVKLSNLAVLSTFTHFGLTHSKYIIDVKNVVFENEEINNKLNSVNICKKDFADFEKHESKTENLKDLLNNQVFCKKTNNNITEIFNRNGLKPTYPATDPSSKCCNLS